MNRLITVAAAQLGPIQKAEGRDVVVARMVRLLERAHQRGAHVVVFPELALTTFFPRWYVENLDEADPGTRRCCRRPPRSRSSMRSAAMGSPATWATPRSLHEADETGQVRKRRFNTSVVIAPSGEIVLKYRKVHLPGHKEFSTVRKVQHLEKRYFEVGNLGFPVVRAPVGNVGGVNLGMLICNDRRWPEAWRELGLQQVELVMLGYNTPAVNQENRGFEAHHLRNFHSQLSIQAGCYQNATFGVGVAKAGNEDGFELMGHSVIVNPQGEIMAMATSWDDELVVADCNLDMCLLGRNTIFNFAQHRRLEAYTRLTSQTGSTEPPAWQAA
jgi:predicted amidohydrolase